MENIVNLIDEKVEKRFWEKVDKSGDNECWLWNAGIGGTSPYGIFHIMLAPYKRKNLPAHKFSYIINNKVNIPDDIQVCHKCDNPICVNPNHLFLGTHKDNMRDMREKGRSSKADLPGELNGKSKLTIKEVREIREFNRVGELTQVEIADLYNVKPACVSKIVLNRTWREQK